MILDLTPSQLFSKCVQFYPRISIIHDRLVVVQDLQQYSGCELCFTLSLVVHKRNSNNYVAVYKQTT